MADPSVQARLKGWLAVVWRFVSRAPLTYVWLIVLLITAIIQHSLGQREPMVNPAKLFRPSGAAPKSGWRSSSRVR